MKRKAGRPRVITEPTAAGNYNLTERQKQWLEQQAESDGVSASDVLRKILKREMERQGEAS